MFDRFLPTWSEQRNGELTPRDLQSNVKIITTLSASFLSAHISMLRAL